jgi:hypothetical protein
MTVETKSRWIGAAVAVGVAAIAALLVMKLPWLAVLMFLGLVAAVFLASWKEKGFWTAFRQALWKLLTGW